MSVAQDKIVKAAVVGRGLSRSVYLKTLAPGAASRDLPFIVRWSFLLFIASLGFDTDLGIEDFSSARLAGFLFFASFLFYHNPLSRKRSLPSMPPVMWWFVIYVAIFALHGLFLPAEYSRQFFVRFFTLLQSILFIWIASDVLKDEKIAKNALFAYSMASIILALGLIFSLPGFDVEGDVGVERAEVMGASGHSFALAIVVMVGLWQNLSHKRLVQSVLMFVSMLALSRALLYTGARSAFLASMMGLSVYLFPYLKHRWRIGHVIFGVIAIASLAYVAVNTPVFYERWREFSEEGKTSGRDRIFAEAYVMISERPLLGWQPVQFEYELGRRTQVRFTRAAHSMYLHLLMEVGVVGAVPFLIGLWLCGWGAWKARNRYLGLLPLALLVATIASGIGSNTIKWKTLWFVLAVTIAAIGEGKRQGIVLARRPGENGRTFLLNARTAVRR